MINVRKSETSVRLATLACIALLVAMPASAAIYRTVDAAGNITYTDQPPPGSQKAQTGVIAEQIDIPAPNTFEEPKPDNGYEPWIPDADEAAVGYQSLVITSPTHDEAFRENAGNVVISSDLRPGLQSGDVLRLEMDGALSEATVEGTQVRLSNVPRGTHRIRMVVVGSDGTRKMESSETIFHLQRYSVNQNRANN